MFITYENARARAGLTKLYNFSVLEACQSVIFALGANQLRIFALMVYEFMNLRARIY